MGIKRITVLRQHHWQQIISRPTPGHCLPISEMSAGVSGAGGVDARAVHGNCICPRDWIHSISAATSVVSHPAEI